MVKYESYYAKVTNDEKNNSYHDEYCVVCNHIFYDATKLTTRK